jgi:hypothetical protein
VWAAGAENESMARKFNVALAALIAVLAFAGNAQAAGGDYVFDGATAAERAQVRAALDASSFPWNLVPAQVTIHVGAFDSSHALPGHIYLDRGLLRAGRFAWATVQDEYAHQVDFFLFDGAIRAQLTSALGAKDWCYGVAGLAHDEYGCERFSSTLVWAYWPSKDNAYRPQSRRDESAALAPAKFRDLMATLVGAPRTAAGARL